MQQAKEFKAKCDQVEVNIEITYPTDDVADAARPVAASLVQRPLQQGMSEVQLQVEILGQLVDEVDEEPLEFGSCRLGGRISNEGGQRSLKVGGNNGLKMFPIE